MTKNNLKIIKSNKNQETETKEKNKALEAAISQIDENFGKGSVMKLGQKAALDVESISTGSLSLDLALGIGGLPKGRVIEIYGPESSGKTTLALQVVAEAQKVSGICGFIDAEHALDPVYAKKLGVKKIHENSTDDYTTILPLYKTGNLAKEKNLYLGNAPDTFLGAAGQKAREIIESNKIGKIVLGTFNLIINPLKLFQTLLPFVSYPYLSVTLELQPL